VHVLSKDQELHYLREQLRLARELEESLRRELTNFEDLRNQQQETLQNELMLQKQAYNESEVELRKQMTDLSDRVLLFSNKEMTARAQQKEQ